MLATAGGPLDATVTVPGSKSIANRALVCAALAEATSELTGVPPGDDTVAMVRCLAALGTPIAVARRPGRGDRDRRAARARGGVLDAGLAGTTSRFVTAVAALAAEPVTDRRRPAAAGPTDGSAARRPRAPSAPPSRPTRARPSAGRPSRGPLRRGGTVALPRRRLQPVPHGADADRPAARRRTAHRADHAAGLGTVRRADGRRSWRPSASTGVTVAPTGVVVPAGGYRGDDVRGRARRLVGELPAGRWPPSPAARSPCAASTRRRARATSPPRSCSAAWAARSPTTAAGSGSRRDRPSAHRHRRRHGRDVRPRADHRRRRRDGHARRR